MEKAITTTGKAPHYKPFLLRMWQESSSGEGWRIKTSTLTGESEHYFADLDSLFAFIVSNTEDGTTPLFAGSSGSDPT